MSIYDIGASSMYVVGSWAIPGDVDNPNTFQPSGSMQTCRAQAFLFQTFASAIPMYNLSVAVYSYLAVNHSWREERMKQYAWCFHLLPATFGTTTAIYGLAHDQFNPNELWCWFSGTEQSDMLKFIVYYGPLWVVFAIIVCLFSLIYRYVRRREEANKRYEFEQNVANRYDQASTFSLQQQQPQSESFSPPDHHHQNPTESHTTNHEDGGGGRDGQSHTGGGGSGHFSTSQQSGRSRRSLSFRFFSSTNRGGGGRLSRPVFLQGLLFSAVFVLIFLFPTIVRSQQLHKENIRFATLFLMTLFLPLQGFLNALVYYKMEIQNFVRRRKRTLSMVRRSTTTAGNNPFWSRSSGSNGASGIPKNSSFRGGGILLKQSLVSASNVSQEFGIASSRKQTASVVFQQDVDVPTSGSGLVKEAEENGTESEKKERDEELRTLHRVEEVSMEASSCDDPDDDDDDELMMDMDDRRDQLEQEHQQERDRRRQESHQRIEEHAEDYRRASFVPPFLMADAAAAAAALDLANEDVYGSDDDEEDDMDDEKEASTNMDQRLIGREIYTTPSIDVAVPLKSSNEQVPPQRIESAAVVNPETKEDSSSPAVIENGETLPDTPEDDPISNDLHASPEALVVVPTVGQTFELQEQSNQGEENDRCRVIR